MKLTIAIPVMNQLEDTKVFWGCLISNTLEKENIELLVINNNSTDGTKEWIEARVFPYFPDHKMINNPENIGVLASMQVAYKESKGDVIAILHNDLFIMHYGWNNLVTHAFENPQIGLGGFLGAEGMGPDGGRMNVWSNLLEAEIHGARADDYKSVVGFDGLALICRREMLDKVGGFDQNYTYHHFYDRDISLASFYAGYHNAVIPVFCHHKSGVTANRPEYQTWIDQKMGTQGYTGDLASYKASEQYFMNKWRGKIPVWKRPS